MCSRYNTVVLVVCKALKGLAPLYVTDLLTGYNHIRPLSLPGGGLLTVPRMDLFHSSHIDIKCQVHTSKKRKEKHAGGKHLIRNRGGLLAAYSPAIMALEPVTYNDLGVVLYAIINLFNDWWRDRRTIPHQRSNTVYFQIHLNATHRPQTSVKLD